jgi:hypothetical protein
MNLLRWILAAATAINLAGFVGLLLLADRFRQSFGASRIGLCQAGLPIMAMVLMLGSLLAPRERLLLHFCAILSATIGLGGLCLLRKAPFLGAGLFGYAVLWLLYYWLALGKG